MATGAAQFTLEVFPFAVICAMELLTILNHCHHHRGFVYQRARFGPDKAVRCSRESRALLRVRVRQSWRLLVLGAAEAWVRQSLGNVCKASLRLLCLGLR